MIADTDVLIDFLNGVEPAASVVAEALRRRELATTVISRFELRRGAPRARRPEPLRALLAQLEAVPLHPLAADRAAAISLELEERGEPLDRADCLIAGIVLTAGQSLLTRNHRHFARIPGLELMRWPDSDAVHEPRASP